MNLIEANIDGLALDMTTNSPVVILAPIGLNKVLPIWIGHSEAWGIAMELSGVKPKRPMTYDLIKEIIDNLKAKLDRVEITRLEKQTFYAQLHISSNGNSYVIDARPSDSIAMALKTGAKIFVNEELFNIQSDQAEDPDKPNLPTDPESLRERVKKINPEDFGKYSL